MSNKQNDLYLEEIARAEEDLMDAEVSLGLARNDAEIAMEWERDCRIKVEDCQEILRKIKDKEF